MCAVFEGVAFGGCPQEFTRVRVAVVSESTKIELMRSKTFVRSPKLVRDCIFLLRIQTRVQLSLVFEFSRRNI